MAISVGFGFTTYTKQIQAQELQKQVDTFVATLQLAKNRSVGRDISPNNTCATFVRYDVEVWQADTSNPARYRMRFICQGDPEQAFDMIRLSPTFTITGLATSPDYIEFNYPYGCTNDACNRANHNITITNTANSMSKCVRVNNLGNITVQDGACT